MIRETSPAPRVPNSREIEYLARRMRAEVVRTAARTIWAGLTRPFRSRGAGTIARA